MTSQKALPLAGPQIPAPSTNQGSWFKRITLRRNVEGWFFASPWILGFVLWTAGPMIASLFIAFSEWDLVTDPRWVGFDNFSTMFSDKLVWHSLKVTSLYAFSAVPLAIVLGLGLA